MGSSLSNSNSKLLKYGAKYGWIGLVIVFIVILGFVIIKYITKNNSNENNMANYDEDRQIYGGHRGQINSYI